MLYICHRVNTIEELAQINSKYGVELDIRDDTDGSLYIYHDPYIKGDDFEQYLKYYHHSFMILNIKSERIEWKIIKLLKKYKIENYFFLDSSFPMIMSMVRKGEANIAIRLSEYESIQNARLMSGKVRWIWLDSFERIPITVAEARELHMLGYKICLVSPELQGRYGEL